MQTAPIAYLLGGPGIRRARGDDTVWLRACPLRSSLRFGISAWKMANQESTKTSLSPWNGGAGRAGTAQHAHALAQTRFRSTIPCSIGNSRLESRPLRYLRYADKALYSIPNNRLTATTPKINVVTTDHPLSNWISPYALYMKAP